MSKIAGRAGVSRSSFYAQFADLDELTMAVLRDTLEQVLELDSEVRDSHQLSALEATRLATERLVEHVDSHRGLYRLALHASPTVYAETERMVARQYQSAKCLTSAPAVGLSIEAAAIYLAAGTLAILRSWISGRLPGDPALITDHLMALLPAWLGSADGQEASDHLA